jgi:hypothetical protein
MSYVVSHNESKPLYTGAIATMVYEDIKEERRFENIGTKISESNLLDSTMLVKMDILIRVWNNDFCMYKFMVKRGSFTYIVLPCLEHFDRLSNRWIIEQEEHEWDLAPEALEDDEWTEEVPEPPRQDVLVEVHAPPQEEWYKPAPPA